MGLRSTLQRLDDNPISNGIVRISDTVGWWWNLGGGAVLLAAGLAILVVGGPRDDAFACLSFGTFALLVGLVLQAGRYRRRQRPTNDRIDNA